MSENQTKKNKKTKQPLTDLGVVVEQQVVRPLVARPVVGARAAVPLHHHARQDGGGAVGHIG